MNSLQTSFELLTNVLQTALKIVMNLLNFLKTQYKQTTYITFLQMFYELLTNVLWIYNHPILMSFLQI